jgi:hypothetical protein
MTIAPSAAVSAPGGLLASLDPEQRAAAVLPDGPAQVIAPAGSGKTTTLIARLGVLLDRGVAADRIGVVTFNREAAAELAARIAGRLAQHVPGAEAIEVRTLHALARQVLLDAGRPVRLLPDRLPLLRAARRRALAELRVAPDGDDPPPEPPDPAALDTIVSAWKVEGRTPPPEAAATVDAFAALMAAAAPTSEEARCLSPHGGVPGRCRGRTSNQKPALAPQGRVPGGPSRSMPYRRATAAIRSGSGSLGSGRRSSSARRAISPTNFSNPAGVATTRKRAGS